jgi:hypothetical protein
VQLGDRRGSDRDREEALDHRVDLVGYLELVEVASPDLYNGGVPSGKAWNLRWSNWGSASTTAHGLTWLYRPHGGYYGKPGAIELRAYRLGKCKVGGAQAYTRLAARVAIRPSGRLGRWFALGWLAYDLPVPMTHTWPSTS